MGKPKRINVHLESKELAESFVEGDMAAVVDAATRPGPSRQILPLLIYKRLLPTGSGVADKFALMVINKTVRD